eukprot:5792713-Amphidinium_carterae.1
MPCQVIQLLTDMKAKATEELHAEAGVFEEYVKFNAAEASLTRSYYRRNSKNVHGTIPEHPRAPNRENKKTKTHIGQS